MRAVAKRLARDGGAHVVVTGGHLERAIDVFGFHDAFRLVEFEVFSIAQTGHDIHPRNGLRLCHGPRLPLAPGTSMPEAVFADQGLRGSGYRNAIL